MTERERQRDSESSTERNLGKALEKEDIFSLFSRGKITLIDKFYMIRLFERKASDKDKRSLPKFNLNQLQRTLSNNLGR